MKRDSNLEETLETYSKLPIPGLSVMTTGLYQSKVFYHLNEWYGWRFYLKAIRNRDWKSLFGHIKTEYFTPTKSV